MAHSRSVMSRPVRAVPVIPQPLGEGVQLLLLRAGEEGPHPGKAAIDDGFEFGPMLRPELAQLGLDLGDNGLDPGPLRLGEVEITHEFSHDHLSYPRLPLTENIPGSLLIIEGRPERPYQDAGAEQNQKSENQFPFLHRR